MPRRVTHKWRPPLAFVLGGTLSAVFLLPIIGIAYFRVAGGILGWGETSWMIFWMACTATGLLGFLLVRLVLRPVKALTAYANSTGEAEVPEHFGTPEMVALGEAVIEMTTTLRGREAVLRSYADHVTHELKSPLTVIRGAAELLDDPDVPEADRKKLLLGVSEAVERMEALLDGQRALARAQEPVPAGTCQLSAVLAPYGAAVYARDGELPLPREVMDLVTSHLVGNALGHGAKEVRFDLLEDQLSVSDDGEGISDGNKDRIFDPFFTTRRTDGGTGMGLPIVQRILRAQGAEIALVNAKPATFEIRF